MNFMVSGRPQPYVPISESRELRGSLSTPRPMAKKIDPPPLTLSNRVKVAIFVPEGYGDAIREAVGKAGAGNFGSYDYCSVSTKVTGFWKANQNAKPFSGKTGSIECATEEKIEFCCPIENLEAVLKAAKKAHPYEEMGYDIYPLLDFKVRQKNAL